MAPPLKKPLNPEEMMKGLGKRLEMWIESHGLSQEEAAEKCGVSRTQVNKTIAGRHAPAGITLVRLMVGLKCPPAFLLGFKREKK